MFVAGVSWFGLTGCGKSSGPDDAAKAVAQGVPVSTVAESTVRKEKSPPVQAAPSRDEALAARVSAALATDARLKSFPIDVRATTGVVEPFGTVDSRSNREKAAKVAAAVEGVDSVKNHLVLVSGS